MKRILLPVHDRDDLSPVAALAFTLAHEFGGEIEGIFPQFDSAVQIALGGDPSSAFAVKDLLEFAEKRAKEAAEDAESAFAKLTAQYPDVDAAFVLPGTGVAEMTARHAFSADLTMIGDRAHFDGDYWSEVREGAVFLSGRPVLVAPSKPVPRNFGERVVIAWKEGSEAARGVAAAMPFIERAREVWLVTVGGGEEAHLSGRRMRKYLELHAPQVMLELLQRDGDSVGELLVRKAAEQEGTILVMGAYSHWRWRERIFGGVTESMLREAEVPVLMAH
ncbi:MAG: universal stress protein [Methyloligellaceae bacterium]